MGVDVSEAAWLLSLRRELVELTREAAATMWPVPQGCLRPYFNYRVEHVKQVERNALRLLRDVGADAEVVLAAVWIHDRFQPLFRGELHGARAAEWATSGLVRHGFPAGKVAAVCSAVARHSEPAGTLANASVEARLLWDADKLSHRGAVGALALVLNNLAADHSARREREGRDPSEGVLAAVARRLMELLGSEGEPIRFYFPVSEELAAAERRTERALLEGLLKELDCGVSSPPGGTV